MSNNDECGGLYFRYVKNSYVDSREGIVKYEKLYPLKGISCRNENCKVCIAQQWHEDVQCVGDDIISMLFFDCVPENGDMLEARFKPISFDGKYVEEWEYHLTKCVQDEEK